MEGIINRIKGLSKMIRNKKAQNIIEYALLITLVIAGVVVAGPYVQRSWNAQTQGWEDSVKDSNYEPLNQSEVLNVLPGNCICRLALPLGCAQPPCCGMAGCAATQDTEMCVCNMVDCSPSQVRPESTDLLESNCDPAINPLCTFTDDCCTEPVGRAAPFNCAGGGCGLDEVPTDQCCGRIGMFDLSAIFGIPAWACVFPVPTGTCGACLNIQNNDVCLVDVICKNQCKGGPDPVNLINNPMKEIGTMCLGDFMQVPNATTDMTFVTGDRCTPLLSPLYLNLHSLTYICMLHS